MEHETRTALGKIMNEFMWKIIAVIAICFIGWIVFQVVQKVDFFGVKKVHNKPASISQEPIQNIQQPQAPDKQVRQESQVVQQQDTPKMNVITASSDEKPKVVIENHPWIPPDHQIINEDGKIRMVKKPQKITCYVDETGKKYYSNVAPSGVKGLKPCP